MKSILFGIFIFFCFLGRSQTSENYRKDSNINQQKIIYRNVEKRIALLQVDSCLSEVLKVIADRNIYCPYYRQGRSCFLLSSSHQVGYYLINIRPTYIDKLDSAFYFGILYLNHTKFICYGEFIKSLFYKSNSDSLNITYQKADLKTLDDTLNYFSDNRILCDGCLKSWSINCNNMKIMINAEICDEPILNYPKTQINKRKKRIKRIPSK